METECIIQVWVKFPERLNLHYTYFNINSCSISAKTFYLLKWLKRSNTRYRRRTATAFLSGLYGRDRNAIAPPTRLHRIAAASLFATFDCAHSITGIHIVLSILFMNNFKYVLFIMLVEESNILLATVYRYIKIQTVMARWRCSHDRINSWTRWWSGRGVATVSCVIALILHSYHCLSMVYSKDGYFLFSLIIDIIFYTQIVLIILFIELYWCCRCGCKLSN